MTFGAKQRGESDKAVESPTILAAILADRTVPPVPVDSATRIPMNIIESRIGTMILKGCFKKLLHSLRNVPVKFQELPR